MLGTLEIFAKLLMKNKIQHTSAVYCLSAVILKYMVIVYVFLAALIWVSGTLLEVRNATEKLMSELLCCDFCVFRHATKNIQYLLSFLRLGWCRPRGNKEDAAHSRSWGKHNTCLWWGAGQLTQEVFWGVINPGTQITLFRVLVWVQWLFHSPLSLSHFAQRANVT